MSPRPSHKQYPKVNLRNTPHPTTGQKQPGLQVYMHRMAVAAAGKANLLVATGKDGHKAEYLTSHLCHNGSCISPDHIQISGGNHVSDL
ncbi:hypothetical protein J3F83DRAFT_715701 [Trichoderma novae-zelandiae]